MVDKQRYSSGDNSLQREIEVLMKVILAYFIKFLMSAEAVQHVKEPSDVRRHVPLHAALVILLHPGILLAVVFSSSSGR